MRGKCEMCFEKDKENIRLIQLYSGHVYLACLDCRKGLVTKPTSGAKGKRLFKFRKWEVSQK